MTFGAKLLPPMLATLSDTLIVAGVVILGLSGTWLPGAVGLRDLSRSRIGHQQHRAGIASALAVRIGRLRCDNGRMAAARLAAGAMAPFVFSVLMERFGTDVALLANAGLGAVGMGAFVAVASAAKASADALTL